MTLQTSGPISLSDIQAEFGGGPTDTLTSYYVGGPYVLTTDYAPNVPTSGPISLSNFYGAARTTLTTITYTNTGSNYLVLPPTFVPGTLTIVSMTGGGGGGEGRSSCSSSGIPPTASISFSRTHDAADIPLRVAIACTRADRSTVILTCMCSIIALFSIPILPLITISIKYALISLTASIDQNYSGSPLFGIRSLSDFGNHHDLLACRRYDNIDITLITALQASQQVMTNTLGDMMLRLLSH